MNLRSVDLNLLVILDALLDEVHVSRAADRLGLSQPATSSALERCRHLFGDRLLTRAHGGMRLTAKAEALREPLKDVLAGIGRVVAPEAPSLDVIRRRVHVVMADLPAILVAGALHRELARTAPGIDIVIRPWQGADTALEGLSRGDFDIAVSLLPKIEASHRRLELFEERYIVAMDRNHPAARNFDLGQWLVYPHVLVSPRGDTHGALDDALLPKGLQRRVGVVVPTFQMVPSLLAGSELIALLPSGCLLLEDACKLAAFDPPIELDGFPLHLAWHRRNDDNPAVQHVARLIQQLLHPGMLPPLASIKSSKAGQQRTVSMAQRPGGTP